jgi:hypothetical protein
VVTVWSSPHSAARAVNGLDHSDGGGGTTSSVACVSRRRNVASTAALTRSHRRFVFQNQNEIHEIPYATVRRLARTRVGVKLLRPMLLQGKCGHDDRGNTGEAEPVFALNTLERLKDFIADPRST